MFERPVIDPRCVLVSLDIGARDAASHAEFEELARSPRIFREFGRSLLIPVPLSAQRRRWRGLFRC